MPQRADPHWGLRLVDVATGAYEDLPHEAHSFAPTWDPVAERFIDDPEAERLRARSMRAPWHL